MDQEKIPGDKIIDHLIDGGGETDQLPELNRWLNQSESNASDWAKYKKIWKAVDKLSLARSFDAHQAFTQIDQNIQQKLHKKEKLIRLSIAVSSVAAVLLVVFGMKLFFMSSNESAGIISVQTAMGDRSTVILPDGTQVKLNAGSHLNYHLDAVNETRDVSFSGEAFFEVAKSKTPFIISTMSGLKVQVLGTKFNLRAYPSDADVQTTLVEGSVSLTSANSGQSLKIKPGQIASFNKSQNELSLVDGIPEHMLSWMDNKLYMDNMNLQEVCLQLERWYNVKIWIKDESLKQSVHYTGVLSEETILDVLEALCQLSPIQYKIDGKKITITKK
ncbi:FecR family protein [Mangrovibacterium diazotrophicum]|uniref:FecR family protein n=1 Tax=Mangrovibacterium diazotrophicum TaxID=1261403 RepID=A0A419VYQ6_9BACT|nr:FecR domain-containing protein [Mangrovibacterium diazotrophicum]RKD88190.1 FecR family protein [Mangrovibacterium diazotrophicum]